MSGLDEPKRGKLMVDSADEAPGWDAIEAAVATRVKDTNPLHWGSNILPGQAGLYGLSAYRSDGYWLLVTFGMTELFAKESDDQDVSGWGCELTMRVPMDADQPPAWALRLLERLVNYVFDSGRPFAEGHRLDPAGPITGEANTRLTAVAFAADPELPPIASPYGSARFLTVVGITADELERMKATTTAAVLRDLADRTPTLVTDPAR
ncbi:suppressor of fused domain protein [Micromonospora sp. NPDC049799]|uniref:suppressor of fused domain protein n=1 Tax=Micromonospora sp. NPDC049799 TaxID=3154741 RepID=UPI0033FB0B41